MRWRRAGLVVAAALPALLAVASVRSYRAIGAMREVFLRHRAAMVAYQLEIAPPDAGAIEELKAHEPDLAAVTLFDEAPAGGPDARHVAALLGGTVLYHAVDSGSVYQVYLPVHRPELTVARIDLSAASADFLTREARLHLIVALAAAAGSLLLLGAYLLATRRRLHRERLAELGEMSAVLAHEIRNPLGTIKGYAQLARERTTGLAAELLDPVIQEAGRLERLVRDLLLFARPEPRRAKVVRWADVTSRLGAMPAGVHLHIEPSDGLEFKADPDALLQILSNLVRNAAEALPDGGDIRLRGRRAGRGVVITVEDNGPGLSTAAWDHLFQPFFTTKASGAGLGLPISRRLAVQLGGRLELEPVEPHGARAVLTLAA
jgi:two-component system sensor histidine kinase HydH